jgi:cholesterol transport system auxiliary component
MKPSFPTPNARPSRRPRALRAVPARPLATLAVVLLAATLGACSFSRPAPVKHMVLLEAAAPPVASVAKLDTLRIGVVTVAAPFRGRTLVYRRDDVTYESDFYSEFFVAPSAMLAEATAKALAAAGGFRRVIPPGAAPDDAGYVLDAFVTELYGDNREAGRPAAVLAATFYLSSATSPAPRVLWSRDYAQRVPAGDGSPEALARAWNAALSALLADLARDLAAAQLPKP